MATRLGSERCFPLPASRFSFIAAGAIAVGALVVAASGLAAQTDPSGAWRTWHTSHFRIHGRAEQRTLALHAAAEAERAYALLARELAPPRGPIDLTLADNVDFSNAFASFFPSNRLTVYVVPPAGSPVLGHYDDWLRVVLIHELTHVFHLDRSRGVWRIPQTVFGRWPAFFPNAYRPSWVSEGLATYYESRLTSAGRLHGGLQAQLLAAATMGRWPGANDATLASPKWPAGFLPYAWGSYFFQWQAREYGDSVVPRFVERTSRRVWPLTISGPLEDAGGVGVSEAWGSVRRVWADSTTSAAAPAATLVARGLRAAPRARVSPDGRYLAYVHADGRDDPRIKVVERGSGAVAWERRINSGVDLAWQDSTLWVAQLDFASPVEIRSRLYRWVPGRSWEAVPNTERLARPFVTGDGRVGAVDLGAHAARLVASPGWQRDGSGTLATPPGDAWSYVAPSPSGEWLAGARHLNGAWDIVIWRAADAGEVIVVTADAGLDDDPAWTPSGETLLFTSERDGFPQIFAFRMDTGALERLTGEPTGARDPSPAPDGTLFYTTVLADGLALVMEPVPEPRPAAPGAADPAIPTAPDVLVPAATVRETGYAAWPSLRPHYWFPTWHDAGTAGRFGGARVGGVDAIGRTAYLAQLALAPATEGRLEGRLEVVHQRWKAFGLTASLQQSWDPLPARAIVENGDTVPVALGLRQREARVGGVASWRRWRTSLALRFTGELEEDLLTIDSSAVQVPLTSPMSRFAGPGVSLSAFHATRPALAVSLENGAAAALVYRRLWELNGDRWWDEVRGTVSGYLALPLPGFAHWVLAARSAVGVSQGPAPRRFAIGGASGERFELLPGYVVGAGRRSFPLRGYPSGGAFTRAAATAVELRIPMALVGRGVWKLPLGLDRVSLTTFAEAGGGWDAGEPAAPAAYGDVGAELMVDGAVSYDIARRTRLGVAVPLRDGLGTAAGNPRVYLTFGTFF